MSFDREQYNKNQRIIGYVSPEKKVELKTAVEDGLAPSVSKLTSDIVDKSASIHISELRKNQKKDDSETVKLAND